MSESETATLSATAETPLPAYYKQLPPIDTYAAQLGGNTADYFISQDEGRIPLVVRHSDGAATHVFDLAQSPPTIVAMDSGGRELIKNRALGVGVQNPPGFTGFPTHDKANPQYDLANPTNNYGSVLGDISDYFVDFEATQPRVIQHSTGLPKYSIINGKLEPIIVKAKAETISDASATSATAHVTAPVS